MSDFVGYIETYFAKLEYTSEPDDDGNQKQLNELLQVAIILTAIKECDKFQATVATIRSF